MGYFVGIDLGTTFTAAAIDRNGRVEMVSLGQHTSAIPSVVFLRETEEMLMGEPAERRGATDPTRVAREFKRRMGDTAPIMLGSSPYSAERITAALLRFVLHAVGTQEGGPPDGVAITYPANWGPYKIEILREAAKLAEVRDAVLLTEPFAAAVHYASNERVDVGDVIAVYDLGGGTFDAAVLRKTAAGFEQLGRPEGIEHLGGVDFDEAVFRHVRTALGPDFDALDQSDPNVRAAVTRLQHDCVAAKEALSSDSDATIPVILPGLQSEIRLTRGEFEAMIRPTLRETVDALRRALVAASVLPSDLKTVLLVGGSSRIPLVSEMVSAELGRPVAVDAHPKHAVALGAALVMGSARRAACPAASAPTAAAATSSAATPAAAPPSRPLRAGWVRSRRCAPGATGRHEAGTATRAARCGHRRRGGAVGGRRRVGRVPERRWRFGGVTARFVGEQRRAHVRVGIRPLRVPHQRAAPGQHVRRELHGEGLRTDHLRARCEGAAGRSSRSLLLRHGGRDARRLERNSTGHVDGVGPRLRSW